MSNKIKQKIFTKKDAVDLIDLIKKMNLPKLSQKQAEKNYREHIMKKYGKNISRH